MSLLLDEGVLYSALDDRSLECLTISDLCAATCREGSCPQDETDADAPEFWPKWFGLPRAGKVRLWLVETGRLVPGEASGRNGGMILSRQATSKWSSEAAFPIGRARMLWLSRRGSWEARPGAQRREIS